MEVPLDLRDGDLRGRWAEHPRLEGSPLSIVGITWKFPDWERKIKAAKREINLVLAASMQTNRGELFDKEGNFNGHESWAPLKFRDGMILSDRGTLRKSMSPTNARGAPGPSGIVKFEGDVITIGTSLAYARIMNDGTGKLPGGVIKAVRAKALKIPVPAGFIKQQKIRKTLLEDDLGNEETLKRKVSLERRIAKIEGLLAETKSNKSKRVKLEYLAKLEASMRASSNRTEIKNLSRRMNRVQGSSGNFIFRKSVKIPARPFDTWTAEDQADFEVTIRNKIVEVLNG